MAKTVSTPAAAAESLRLRPRILWLQKPWRLSRQNFVRLPYIFVKRLFDILFAVIGCVLLVPIAAVVKIAYLLDGDRHPIFYAQPRIGKNGKNFKMYKFRSMVWDADEKLAQLLKTKKYRVQWDSYQKIDNDPRITKIGEIIRNTSIDEMPQFINLLKGEMSLIGPRPVVPGELKSHKVHWRYIRQYNLVRPGISGYWATNGRSNISYDDRVKMELFYVDNYGFSLDAKIFFQTFASVLKRDGAK